MIFLLDLPKPIHGMSNVNLAMLEHFKEYATPPKVINSVPSYAANYFGTRYWPLIKLLHTIACYFRFTLCLLKPGKQCVYRPINGGFGQCFDLIYILLARLRASHIFIHHHSFQYLNQHSGLFKLLNSMLGKKATHIVLGQAMSDRLQSLYGIDSRSIRQVSNLAFFAEQDNQTQAISETDNALTIGHLANLCIEKGAHTFVSICRQLHKQGIEFKALIAGPFADRKTETIVKQATSDLPELSYLGPLYGEEKSAFYRSLNVFIFPSEYVNEAEPLVLYEAAQYGNYLIGSKRGCMGDVIDGLQGISVTENEHLAETISTELIKLIGENKFNQALKPYQQSLFNTSKTDSTATLQQLMEEMSSHELSKS